MKQDSSTQPSRLRATTIASIALSICGLLLSVGVSTVFSACGPAEDGSFMHCHDAQVVLTFIGIGIAVCGLIRTKLSSPLLCTLLAGIALVASIAAIAIPQIMPLCMMDMMRCRAVMTPFARVLGCACAILSCACIAVRGEGH